MHLRTGSVGATDMHGRQAPCICEAPANAPADMPLQCQADLLRTEWCLEFDSLPRDGRAASKSRYELRRCWAKHMGIKVIRVDVPECVKDLLRDEFGAGTSQFVAGENKCSCDSCVAALQEAEAEAFDNDAAHDATAGDEGGDDDAGGAD